MNPSLDSVLRTVDDHERITVRIGCPVLPLRRSAVATMQKNVPCWVLCFATTSDLTAASTSWSVSGMRGCRDWSRSQGLSSNLPDCSLTVDLVFRAAIEENRNYIRSKAILESARVV